VLKYASIRLEKSLYWVLHLFWFFLCLFWFGPAKHIILADNLHVLLLKPILVVASINFLLFFGLFELSKLGLALNVDFERFHAIVLPSGFSLFGLWTLPFFIFLKQHIY
jgi:hypothetical protein